MYSLPIEILIKILKELTLIERLKLRRTSKKFLYSIDGLLKTKELFISSEREYIKLIYEDFDIFKSMK